MSKFAYVALCSAAMSLVVSASALAQDATTTTPGGDVSADEATPLPPVVVEAPSKPIRTKVKAANAASGPVTVAADASDIGEVAGEGVPGTTVGVYTLGQLDMIGGSTITNEAMYTYNKNSLGQAVNLLPGVSWLSTGAPSINSSG